MVLVVSELAMVCQSLTGRTVQPVTVKILLLLSPFIAFFAATLLIAGCSKSSTEAGLEKEDLDGDGIANIYDPDIDGDGIPNGQDPDIDGDGIPNDQDPDIDGDGKPNGKDPDPENNDPNYCDQIHVFGLDEDDKTGSEIELTWEIQSSKTGDENCVLKEGVTAGFIQVAASAGDSNTKSEQTNPLVNPRAMIPIPNVGCEAETVEVTYDFTEIADLIKADPNAPGWTVKQRHRADPERCDTDGDGFPDFGPAQCPTGATGTYPNCSCPDGEEYDGATNSCEVVAATCVFVNQSDLKTAVRDYERGGGNGKYKDGSAYAHCGLIGTWDVSAVSSMSYVFMGYDEFNEDISGWDVSNVTDMSGMFHEPNGYFMKFNQDISGWDVSNVRKMAEMFYSYAGAAFNQDLSGWCVKNIGSKPSDFDTNAGFEGQDEKQPKWGQPCDGSSVSVSSNDSDGDGIPNGSDPDVDGDGTPNTSDKDIDGDGIENKNDPDIDGDGISNGIDPDANGDGIPDAEDDTPGGPS